WPSTGRPSRAFTACGKLYPKASCTRLMASPPSSEEKHFHVPRSRTDRVDFFEWSLWQAGQTNFPPDTSPASANASRIIVRAKAMSSSLNRFRVTVLMARGLLSLLSRHTSALPAQGELLP